MQPLTEREEKLVGYLKVMINFMTIWGIYEDGVKKTRDWAFDSLRSTGVSMEWQNEMLHFLEDEFGVVYTKVNPETSEEKEDGNQNSEGV